MSETELHKEIMKLFKKLGIFYIHSRTDRRTTQRKGIPDFLFAYHGHAMAWEVKVDGNKLSKDQVEVREEMRHPINDWMWFEINSCDDANRILRILKQV